ncbi:MAG: hypothetical protein IJ532_05025 [Alphaproteobacteria bacterium]|nr:hypothetical protein [Alphaproteobacteria bacterium]
MRACARNRWQQPLYFEHFSGLSTFIYIINSILTQSVVSSNKIVGYLRLIGADTFNECMGFWNA